MGRRVCFGACTVRYYAIDVSDNPGVSSGVPVGLGWELLGEEYVDLSNKRSCVRWLDPKKRREMLYDAGYASAEVEAMRDNVVAAQRDRLRSLTSLRMAQQLPWFVARSVRRTVRRTLKPENIRTPEDVHQVSKSLGLTSDGSYSTQDLCVLSEEEANL